MLETDNRKLLEESFLRQFPEHERKRMAEEFENRLKNFPTPKFGFEYHKEKCPECGRRILVQIVLNGVSHNMGATVICAECLKKQGVNEEFKKERPEEAEDIEKWLCS